MKTTTITAMKDDLLESLRLPEILGERCVHGFMENASCRACVDSCPQDAWVLDDEQLGIKPDACDNCGLCAAACTESAILHHHEALTGEWKNHPLALCACEKQSGMDKVQKGIVPCIHALGTGNLLTLYRKGFRLLYLSTASCDDCERSHNGERLENRIKNINSMLEQRSLVGFKIRFVSGIQWQRIAEKITETQSGRQVNRRNFLRQVLAETAEKTLQAVNFIETERQSFSPPATLLPAANNFDTLPYVPKIEPDHCTACGACIRLCPHEALEADPQIDNPCYRIHAERCSGCMICSDVCNDNAISVKQWTTSKQQEIALHSSHCHSCGIEFFSTTDELARQCSICASSGHTNNLFQVLD